MPDFLISSGHEQEKDIAANLQHRMFLMTATVLLTAALLRGLIAPIAPVAGQVGRGLHAGPGLVVQRQTELLLEEAALLCSRLLYEQAVDDFLRDIALHDPEVMDPDTLQARAAALGLTPREDPHPVLNGTRRAGDGPFDGIDSSH